METAQPSICSIGHGRDLLHFAISQVTACSGARLRLSGRPSWKKTFFE
jgi:hypothetical protein